MAKIGDIVCTTPLFRAIKKKYPKSYLAVAIREQNYGLVQNNPHIDKFIFPNAKKYQGFLGEIRLVKEISKEKFTWSIVLGPSSLSTILSFWAGVINRVTTTSKFTGIVPKLFSWFNNYKLEYKERTPRLKHDLRLLKFLGIKSPEKKKEIFITKQEEKKAKKFLKENNLKEDDFIVGISVTAGVKMKEWEPIKFCQLADKLIEELKTRVIFVGANYDRKIIEKVVAKMKNKAVISTDFKLNELGALMKKLKLFISVDTGPLYIAHALGVPVVDIIGPVDDRMQPPHDKKSEIVQKKIYCAPCYFFVLTADFCKEGHHRCIRETTVDDVFRATKRLLNRVY